MSRAGAERALTTSALVVFGVYFYRLLTEGHSSSGGGVLQLGGRGAPPNVGRFITGWGFAFLVLAVITEAAPAFGGSLSILVAAGDVLSNADQVTRDVNHKLGVKDTTAPAASTAAGQVKR
jgi:amino acid transporter